MLVLEVEIVQQLVYGVYDGVLFTRHAPESTSKRRTSPQQFCQEEYHLHFGPVVFGCVVLNILGLFTFVRRTCIFQLVFSSCCPGRKIKMNARAEAVPLPLIFPLVDDSQVLLYIMRGFCTWVTCVLILFNRTVTRLQVCVPGDHGLHFNLLLYTCNVEGSSWGTEKDPNVKGVGQKLSVSRWDYSWLEGSTCVRIPQHSTSYNHTSTTAVQAPVGCGCLRKVSACPQHQEQGWRLKNWTVLEFSWHLANHMKHEQQISTSYLYYIVSPDEGLE